MNVVSVISQNTRTDRVTVPRKGRVVGRGAVMLINVVGNAQTYRIVNHRARERTFITTTRQVAIARMVDTIPA